MCIYVNEVAEYSSRVFPGRQNTHAANSTREIIFDTYAVLNISHVSLMPKAELSWYYKTQFTLECLVTNQALCQHEFLMYSGTFLFQFFDREDIASNHKRKYAARTDRRTFLSCS